MPHLALRAEIIPTLQKNGWRSLRLVPSAVDPRSGQFIPPSVLSFHHQIINLIIMIILELNDCFTPGGCMREVSFLVHVSAPLWRRSIAHCLPGTNLEGWVGRVRVRLREEIAHRSTYTWVDWYTPENALLCGKVATNVYWYRKWVLMKWARFDGQDHERVGLLNGSQLI